MNGYTSPYRPDNDYVLEDKNNTFYEWRPKGDVQGPDCADFPKGLANAPVVWDYKGKVINMEFKAGFVGASQDEKSGTIKPVVGWFIQKKAAKKSGKKSAAWEEE